MSRDSRSSESEEDDRKKQIKENSDPEEDTQEEKRSRKRTSSKSYRSKRESPPKRSRRKSKYDYSRSRSRSRSVSGKPASEDSYNRHKEIGNRDNPEPSHCLGVFGLSSFSDEKDLQGIFGQYGEVTKINLIKDKDYGTSKGFGFIYFKTVEDAVKARSKTQGLELDRKPIRVDFSITDKPHPPTPGRYLGSRSQQTFRRYDDYYRRDRRRFSDYRDSYNERGYGRRDSRMNYDRRDYERRDYDRRDYDRRDYDRRDYERHPSYRSSFDGDYYNGYEESYSRRPQRYSSYQSSRHY